MSVLNTANDGLHSILVVLCRALRKFGPRSQDSLEMLCAGEGGDTKRVRNTLNRWAELGLFSIEGDTVAFASESPVSAISSRVPLNHFTDALPSIAREISLADANNTDLWAAERNRAADLTRGLAWLLAQDIYTFTLGGHKAGEAVAIAQMTKANSTFIQNDVRWVGLRNWAHFLGFCTRTGKREYMDPTRAITDVLPAVFADETTLTASQFIDRLGAALPVLDGGRYRRDVENRLDAAHWQAPPTDRTLSTSLSHALWGMQLRETLELPQRADAVDTLALARAGGASWAGFSHVIWTNRKRKR